MKKLAQILFLVTLSSQLFAQVRDYELGSLYNAQAMRRNPVGGFFDYSDPEAINIKISVWGVVKYPGKYIIPDYTNIIELMSYVGGPTDDSNLDDLRLYRVDENGNEQMILLDFNDLMWEEELDTKIRRIPSLKPSDILIVPGEPRMYFTDWFGIGLSIFSALVSLTILVLTIQSQ